LPAGIKFRDLRAASDAGRSVWPRAWQGRCRGPANHCGNTCGGSTRALERFVPNLAKPAVRSLAADDLIGVENWRRFEKCKRLFVAALQPVANWVASAGAALMARGFSRNGAILWCAHGAAGGNLYGAVRFWRIGLDCSSTQSRNFSFGFGLGAGTLNTLSDAFEGRRAGRLAEHRCGHRGQKRIPAVLQTVCRTKQDHYILSQSYCHDRSLHICPIRRNHLSVLDAAIHRLFGSGPSQREQIRERRDGDKICITYRYVLKTARHTRRWCHSIAPDPMWLWLKSCLSGGSASPAGPNDNDYTHECACEC